MKKTFLFLLLGLCSQIIFAQKVTQYFEDAHAIQMTIENQTGARLFSIHVCKSLNSENEPDENDWQDFLWSDDLIPSRFFEDDQAEQIIIPVDEKTPCNWDIMVKETQNDPTPIIFTNVDFCHLKKLVFFMKNGQVAYKVE
jgi:hypothetical protein